MGRGGGRGSPGAIQGVRSLGWWCLGSGEQLQLGHPSAFQPCTPWAVSAPRELSGAELKGRKCRDATAPPSVGRMLLDPLCQEDAPWDLAWDLHGEGRCCRRGLAPPGCSCVCAQTPLRADNGFLVSPKRTRIISQLLSTLSINNDNAVKPH